VCDQSGLSGRPVDEVRARLRPVLADVTLPAHRWELVAEADRWGVDRRTRFLLLAVPGRIYRGLGDLAAEIVRPRAHR
jgi:hypothetical protein